MYNNDILYQPFDIEVHKENFINKLEIVILEDGSAVYAVPSHQEKRIALACEKALVTREVLCDMCPIEYYASFDIWLSQIAHAIPVWTTFYRGNPNEKQLATLQRLKEEALYNGNL